MLERCASLQQGFVELQAAPTIPQATGGGGGGTGGLP
jgi:hypothetical protein